MAKMWSREHLVRRVDRYYLLAAAAKLPELRRRYIDYARRYRRLLSLTPASAT
jgi:hypothetical protein